MGGSGALIKAASELVVEKFELMLDCVAKVRDRISWLVKVSEILVLCVEFALALVILDVDVSVWVVASDDDVEFAS